VQENARIICLAGFLDVEIQQARAEHLEAQAERFGVEHVYQTCIVVLLGNPTNGQEPIGHRSFLLADAVQGV